MFATVGSYDADGIVVNEALPSREYRVLWRDVHLFRRTDKGLSCWYTAPDGRVATARASRRLAAEEPRNAWREALTRDFEDRGELDGFCALAPGELAPAGPIRRLAVTLAGILLAVLVLAFIGRLAPRIAAVLQSDNPEIQRVALSGVWILGAVLLATGACLAMAFRERLILWRFRSWRITRDGLLRRERHGGWTSVPLADGHGRPNTRIPIGRFSKPVLAGPLLRLLQERQGVVHTSAASLFGHAPFRLALLWPAVLFLVLTLIPRSLGLVTPFSGELPRALAVYYALGAACAALLLLAELALARSRQRRHSQTVAVAVLLRQRLRW